MEQKCVDGSVMLAPIFCAEHREDAVEWVHRQLKQKMAESVTFSLSTEIAFRWKLGMKSTGPCRSNLLEL